MAVKRLLVLGLVAAFALAAVPQVSADHAQTGSVNYIIAAGVRVFHGIPGVTGGPAVTACNSVTVSLGGCIGGSPNIQGSDCVADATLCHAYKKATGSATDTLSGPNIFMTLCIMNPGGGGVCESDQSGSVDGFKDAAAQGCGVALQVDSNGIHDGHVRATAFTFNFWADPSTTNACIGSSGTVSVVFTP